MRQGMVQGWEYGRKENKRVVEWLEKVERERREERENKEKKKKDNEI